MISSKASHTGRVSRPQILGFGEAGAREVCGRRREGAWPHRRRIADGSRRKDIDAVEEFELTPKVVLPRFDGHLKTGDTCPDGVRLNRQAFEAQVY